MTRSHFTLTLSVFALVAAAWLAGWVIASSVPYQPIHPAVGSEPVLFGGGH